MRLIPVLLLAAAACADPGNATFSVRDSVRQIHVWKAKTGQRLDVVREGAVVTSGVADEQGSFVFRRLAPGDGYTVRSGDEYTRELVVKTIEESAPEPGFHASQKLVPGFQYLTMRDGTTLSAYVTLPGAPEDGPYPTVVNYSGYSASRPGGKVGDYELLCGELPALCDAPDPEASLFAALMGYATVNVNIRGTGCSGGAYDYFETMQLLDGYDVIEIAAAQEWALHHKVGMVGLSYPGITQLFVASLRPPGLAAITPLSVIGNTVTTLVPGGILNDGFALSWVTAVLDKAKPWGQGWERARADAGDTTCAENQLLHSQRVDNVAQARAMPFAIPEIVDPLNPETFVGDIDVPVFLAGAWQDEQTGPYFGVLLDRFRKAPAFRAMVQNGVHVDAYAPAIFYEWKSFLDLFVAKQVPRIPDAVRGLAPMLFDEVFSASMSLPSERFTSHDTHASALAAWRAEPKVHVIFESGTGSNAGAPEGGFTRTFERWPPPALAPRRFFLSPDGSLAPSAPTVSGAASSFAHDEEAGQRTIVASGGEVWNRAPAYHWRQPAAGTAAIFETAPLTEPLAMAGSASVDFWVRSTANEADLEVNLTEVRADGLEMYVQSGWLRASKRKLGAGSSDLYPEPTYLEADHRPLVPGEWVEARVAIAPFAHAFRAGSRVRLSIDTPGDSRADWRFALAPVPGGTKIDIGHDATRASSVLLPVVAGVSVPSALPACTVRGQQCRTYVPYANVAASP